MGKFICSYVIFFIVLTNIVAYEVAITGVDNKKKVYEFDDMSNKIVLSKTVPKIKTIEGLDRFLHLRTLCIDFSDLRQMDFSCLAKLKQLKNLSFSFASLNDFSFLNMLPNLLAFDCSETYRVDNLKNLDISDAKALEYFSLSGVKYETFPLSMKFPSSMKVVALYNSQYYDLSKKNKYKEIDVSELKQLCITQISFCFDDDIVNIIKQNNIDIKLVDKKYIDDYWYQLQKEGVE
jgi:Leucine-rich repeat (LRR) protein